MTTPSPPTRTATPAEMVREFHEVFGHPVRSRPDAAPADVPLRVRLLREEVREYAESAEAGDVVGLAGKLADIVYVAYGAALVHAVDLDAVIREVHRANLTKLGEDGRPILDPGGKVVKGPGFVPADVARVLREGGVAA